MERVCASSWSDSGGRIGRCRAKLMWWLPRLIPPTSRRAARASRKGPPHGTLCDSSGATLQRSRAALSKARLLLGAPAQQTLDLKYRASLYLRAATGLAADASFSTRL